LESGSVGGMLIKGSSVWNAEKKEVRFVEVKGPGDSLSETQKVCLAWHVRRGGKDVDRANDVGDRCGLTCSSPPVYKSKFVE